MSTRNKMVREIEHLRKENARLRDILGRVDSALSDAFFSGHEVSWEKIPPLPGYEAWLEEHRRDDD